MKRSQKNKLPQNIRDRQLIADSFNTLFPDSDEINVAVAIMLQFEELTDEEKNKLPPILVRCVNTLFETVKDRIKDLKIE